MLKVKICGTTNLGDALLSVKAGADALGFVFAESPREADPETVRRIIEQLPPWIATVGVFMNESIQKIQELRNYCQFVWVQLHGSEPAEVARHFFPYVMKTIEDAGQADDSYPCNAWLLDQPKSAADGMPGQAVARSGTSAEIRTVRPLILAGGLTVENIEDALSRIKWPNLYGVDVARGVEASPGKKDPDKILKLIHKVKGFKC